MPPFKNKHLFYKKYFSTFFQKPIDNSAEACYNTMVSDKDVSKDSRFP